VIYAVLRAIIDSFVEWASKPREVRLVGGGKRFADRVRAEIDRRTRQPDANHRGDRPRPSGRA
jgi:hypothetical protein